jgi:hypothetical protein
VTEIIFDWIPIFSGIAIIGGTIVALLELLFMYKSAHADHERRKKQSVVEFYDRISERTFDIETEIRKISNGKNPIPMDVIHKNNMETKIMEYLTQMERLAVAINNEIYDIDVYSSIAGKKTIAFWSRLSEYIAEKRKKQESAYSDYEKLANTLRCISEAAKKSK